MPIIRKLQTSIADKTAYELAMAQAAQNAANIEYIAMMTDIGIDVDTDINEEEAFIDE